MFERRTIDGRPATLFYITDDFEPAEVADATLCKVSFDDGEVAFIAPSLEDDEAEDAEFKEGDHPRGGGGKFKGKGSKSTAKPKDEFNNERNEEVSRIVGQSSQLKAERRAIGSIVGNAETGDGLIFTADERIKEQGQLQKLGVTPTELAMMWAYTEEGEDLTAGSYMRLNNSLRSDRLSGHQKVAVDVLVRVLDKLPKFNGVVVRGADMAKAQFAKYEVGAVIQEKSFLSTSRLEPHEAKYTFEVKSKNGRDISKLSAMPFEGEVLFKPNSKFRVTKVSGKIIRMVEVE